MKPFHPLALLFLAAALVFIGWLYGQGLSAPFQFDDHPNLSWLGGEEPLHSWMETLLTAGAGPSARPLSLLSFLPQASHWPNDSRPFLWANLWIHLANALVLSILLWRLAALMAIPPSCAAWVAVWTAALWAGLPLLASTSLMAVQRMTLLSGLFVLLGVVCYLEGRRLLATRPRAGFRRIACSLFLFTPLATLCKENGALLPLYLLILEVGLLAGYRSSALHSDALSRSQRNLLYLLLLTPVAALFLYLAMQFPAFLGGFERREFGMGERLLTESVILWEYLRMGGLPMVSQLGPYHDDYPYYVSLWQWQPALAMGGWLALIGLTIRWRHRTSLPLFAVAWYLGGHLLESTIIPLELYFEHRNYIPLIGPLFALTCGVFQVAERYRWFPATVLSLYLAFQLLQLGQVTQLWGDRQASARVWAQTHPGSIRAMEFLAQGQMEAGAPIAALETLTGSLKLHPGRAELLLQVFRLRCELQGVPAPARPEELAAELAQAPYSSSAVGELKRIADLLPSGRCRGLSREGAHGLVDALLKNEAFHGSRSAAHHLHRIKALLYEQEGLLLPTLTHLQAAFRVMPSLDSALHFADILMEAGAPEQALRFIDDAMEVAPRNPLLRAHWEARLGELGAVIRRQAAQTPGSSASELPRLRQ